jgi:hypothetical protein
MLPVPKITEKERQLRNVVKSISELRKAKRRLTGASFFCAHAGGMEAIELHLKKLSREADDVLTFLEKLYASQSVLYPNVQSFYDSLEIKVNT